MPAKLFYRDAQGRQISLLLKASGTRLGSTPDCDLRLAGTGDPDSPASAVRVYQQGEQGPWLLETQGELFLNEQPLQAGASHTLTSNDVIRRGNQRLLFRTITRRDTPTGMIVWPPLGRTVGSGGPKDTAPRLRATDSRGAQVLPAPPAETPLPAEPTPPPAARPTVGLNPPQEERVPPQAVSLRPEDALMAGRLATVLQALAEEKQRCTGFQQELEQARAQLKQARDEDALARLKTALGEAEREIGALRLQRDRLLASHAVMQEEKAQLLGHERTRQQQEEALRGVSAQLQLQLAAKQQALVQAEQRLRSLSGELAQSEARCGALQAQLETLQARDERQRGQLEAQGHLRAENQRLREQLAQQGDDAAGQLVRDLTVAQEQARRAAKEREDLQLRLNAMMVGLRPALAQLRQGLFLWEDHLPDDPQRRREAQTLLHKIEQAVLALRAAAHQAEGDQQRTVQVPERPVK